MQNLVEYIETQGEPQSTEVTTRPFIPQAVIELKEKLRNGIVYFTYKKKDGTMRTAKGTTMLDLIPEENHPKGVVSNKPEDHVCYWDLDREGWRSFKNANFVKIDKFDVKPKHYSPSNLI